MKCYTVQGTRESVAGFAIAHAADGPYVSLDPGLNDEFLDKRVLLSETLAKMLQEAQQYSAVFQHETSRIMTCDLDKRSRVYFVEEAEPGCDDALVTWSWWAKRESYSTCSVNISCVDPGAEIIDEIKEKHYAFESTGFVGAVHFVLARMSRGSSLRVDEEQTTKSGHLLNGFRKSKTEIYQRVLTFHKSGTLSSSKI